MARILLIFAHPALEKSRVHKELIKKIPIQTGIYFHDLYEAYPDFLIDIKREQNLLLEHDLILFQFPLFWYSAPAIVKQWMELVLEHGWAYGKNGKALSGKGWMNIISSGGSKEAYQKDGRNHRTIHEFLYPFEQTARLCSMDYWPPFVIHGTHRLESMDIRLHASQYEQLLLGLLDDRISLEERTGCIYMNDLIPIPSSIQS